MDKALERPLKELGLILASAANPEQNTPRSSLSTPFLFLVFCFNCKVSEEGTFLLLHFFYCMCCAQHNKA